MASETRRKRRMPYVWFTLSAIVLLIYCFSATSRTEWRLNRDPSSVSLLLADGRLACTVRETHGVDASHELSFETVSWEPEVRLMPKWGSTVGLSAAEFPLWLVAVPVWVITILKWHGAYRFPPGHCQKCGYDLRGLVDDSNRCPECGSAVPKGVAT